METVSVILEVVIVFMQFIIITLLVRRKTSDDPEVEIPLPEEPRVEPVLYKKTSVNRKHHNKNFLNSELIQTINFLYKHRGMNYKQIAELLGTSTTTVWRYVDHEFKPGDAPKNTESTSNE